MALSYKPTAVNDSAGSTKYKELADNARWEREQKEKEWAANQEERRRQERVEEQAAQQRAAEQAAANARKAQQEREAAEAAALAKKQEDLRKQNEAAQKAAQEKAKAEAYQRAQQEAAAQAAAQRQQQAAEQAQREAAAEAARQQREREAAEAQAQAQKEADLRAQREAAQRAAQERAKAEAYARAQQEAAARAAQQRAEQAQREAAAQRAAEIAERQRQRDAATGTSTGTTTLSYSGAGAASPQTQQREEQWMAGSTSESQPAASGTVPEITAPAETPISSQPSNVYEATRNYRDGTPGNQRYDARQAYVYTPQTTTQGSTAAARNTAANTKAALTADEEELMDWINENPELYNRNVQAWKDTGLSQAEAEVNARRNIAGQLGISYQPPATTQPQQETTDLSYSFTPPSEAYETNGEIINPNIGRNSTGEWRALQQEDQWIREGYAEAQKQPGWTERDRRAYAQYYAQQKESEQPASTEETWQDRLAQRRAEAVQNANRPGAANALDDIMGGGNQQGTGGTTYDPRTQAIIDKAKAEGLTYGGANQPGATGKVTGTTSTTGNSTGSKSGSGSGKNDVSSTTKAKGKNTYFKPSYGQAMDQGVKLPYKAGGYTAAEIEAAGNKARSDERYNSGDKAYEGYYLWNGVYYPIDQEKAAYYKEKGNYNGWSEPMREYYKTFGTYYGYRPDWKTAGGKNVWKVNNNVYQNYRPAKSGSTSTGTTSTLSYSGASSGRSYGRGSTANNGLYWNPNTSWSI